jgi:hypothetical protein
MFHIHVVPCNFYVSISIVRILVHTAGGDVLLNPYNVMCSSILSSLVASYKKLLPHATNLALK